MENKLKRLLLRSILSPNRVSPNLAQSGPAAGGFTLTELLVVVIIGSLIVSTLMSLVVELVATEQRESAQTETQREMKLAMDYITSDLRQAVYVYDGRPQRKVNGALTTDSYLDYLPNSIKGAAYKPALAFWKPEPLDPVEAGIPGYKAAGCNSLATPELQKECNNLWLQRRTYALVVYMQVKNDEDDPKWKGRSRLVRYQLNKYKDPKKFERNPGYVDPGELGAGGFDSWPWSGPENCQTSVKCGRAAAGAPAGGDLVTLVDFVDLVDASNRDNRNKRKPIPPIPECEGYNTANPEASTYLMQPRNTSEDPPAFYTCIGNANLDSKGDYKPAERSTTDGVAQDIQIYLRGNPLGRGSAKDKPIAPMRTRLTMRGVIDKNVVAR